MSKRVKRMIVASSVLMSPAAYAQVVDISWGAQQPVPLSPALTVAIGLLLGLAAYAFLRKRAGHGLLAMFIASALGVMGYHDKSMAVTPVAYTIHTSSGSVAHTCSEPLPNYLGTDVAGGVTLTRVQVRGRPINPATVESPATKSVAGLTGSVQTQNGYPACEVGLHLANGELCRLPCAI